MRGAVLALLVGCSFEHGVVAGTDGAVIADTTGDAAPCQATFLDVCAGAPPGQSLRIATADTIDTDTDPRCITVEQVSGGPVCLVLATTVTIDTGGTLTATGSRPLAIASASTLSIAGAIDVSSRRTGQRGPGASDAACAPATTPEADGGGAGGGAGGSFGAAGGDGGTGDTDDSQGNDGTGSGGTAGAPVTVMALRGGCRGQRGGDEGNTGGKGGNGGDGGGALYLYAAQSIQIAGSIRATGAGGSGGQVQAGGGGGGSGGLIVIESPTIKFTGTISANGGGGGEGGGRVGQTPVTGQPGADGALGIAAAEGGKGTDNRFGYGGAGGASTSAAAAGTSSVIGGGGGGGSVGIIKLIGVASGNGVISPLPM